MDNKIPTYEEAKAAKEVLIAYLEDYVQTKRKTYGEEVMALKALKAQEFLN